MYSRVIGRDDAAAFPVLQRLLRWNKDARRVGRNFDEDKISGILWLQAEKSAPHGFTKIGCTRQAHETETEHEPARRQP